MISWEKLQGREITRSFENFLYVLAKTEYSDKGIFTDFDDTTNPGDGIEFYMKSHDGLMWGWQGKWFYPDRKLSISSRKIQIKKSLKKALKNHPNLVRFYLCTPLTFTTNDNEWFESLNKEIEDWYKDPNSMIQRRELTLIHWSENDYSAILFKPENVGLREYFFNEKEININYFKNLFETKIEPIKKKYIPELHQEDSVEKELKVWVKEKENILLKIKNFKEISEKAKNSLNEYILPKKIPQEFQNHKNIVGENAYYFKNWEEFIEKYLLFKKNYIKWIDRQIIFFDKIKFEIINQKKRDFNLTFEKCDYYPFNYYFNILSRTTKIKNPNISTIEYEYEEIIFYINRLQTCLYFIKGKGGYGKTHLSCSIVEDCLKNNQPVIFLKGSEFSASSDLKHQLLEYIDFPTKNWNEFCKTLEVVSLVYKSDVIIVIDAINESNINGVFNSRWNKEIPEIIFSLNNTKCVKLILTSRNSYENLITSNVDKKFLISREIYGFIENPAETIEKYFNKFQISLDLTPILIKILSNPLILRLFCEVKANNVTKNEEINNIIDIYELFLTSVFNNLRKNINEKSLEIITREDFDDLLIRIVKYIWVNDERWIDLDKYKQILNLNKEKYNEIGLNLLTQEEFIFKDFFMNSERIQFGFDGVVGYLISKLLIKKRKLNKKSTINKLIENQHSVWGSINQKFQRSRRLEQLNPFFEDILSFIPIILIVNNEKNPFKFKICRISPISFESIFFITSINEMTKIKGLEENLNELWPQYASSKINLDLFMNFFYSGSIENHPLNFYFLSRQLKKLPMYKRDCFWSEIIRYNYNVFKTFVDEFIQELDKIETNDNNKIIFLKIEFIFWMLTTTIHNFRNYVSESIFEFGKIYPDYFLSKLLNFIKIRDPYITERMLGCCYGLVMFFYNSKSYPNKKDFILKSGLVIFDNFFSQNAKYSTTHIQTRQYARFIIELSLLIDNTLIKQELIPLIRPPYQSGGIRQWDTASEDEIWCAKDGQHPIYRLNFGNYTIGNLVKNRSNHDYEHLEYNDVLEQIYWRMKTLGYHSKYFGFIDSQISRLSYYPSDEKGKIDRYGKKYSWMAYFELAGYRRDLDLVCDYYKQSRNYEYHIDPSFPKISINIPELENYCFLDDHENTLNWIKNGSSKGIEPFLKVKQINNLKDSWILLGGRVNQRNYDSIKEKWIKITALLLDTTEKFSNNSEFEQYFQEKSLNYEPISISQVFCGEIPWNNIIEEYYEIDWKYNDRVVPLLYEFSSDSENFKENIYFPSIVILRDLKLKNLNNSFSFFDENLNTTAISIRMVNYDSDLCYIRLSALEKYLKNTNGRFIQYIFGEHQLNYHNEKYKDFIKENPNQKTYSRFDAINILNEDCTFDFVELKQRKSVNHNSPNPGYDKMIASLENMNVLDENEMRKLISKSIAESKKIIEAFKKNSKKKDEL